MDDRTYAVGLIVGSVSEPSLNRRLGDALVRLGPRAGLELSDIPIGGLPFYGTQYDAGFPPVAQAFKKAVDAADALVLVTPEYDRSIPGVLKNAIDWASRPPGRSSFSGTPVGVIGTSTGNISTAVAQAHLKSIMAAQGAPLVDRPEAYIKYVDGLVDDDGRVTDAGTEEFLLTWLRELRLLIDRWR